MPISYRPEDAVMCWPEAEYDVVLKKVEDSTSKTSGNPMQVWTWEAHHNDGRTQLISDYVVIPAATFKIKQLARALNKEDEFKAGKFQADNYIGCCVTAELNIESQPNYDDKNKIGKLKVKAAPENGSPIRQNIANRPRAGAEVLGGPGIPEEDIPFLACK